MRQLPDIDAVILLATALASKRGAATLVAIVAAADLLQGLVPYPEKLGDAMRRLSTAGLICALDDGFALTPAAEKIIAALPKKAETEERLATVHQDLANHVPAGESAVIVLDAEQLGTAIRTHKAEKGTSGQNLLMPKAKPDRHFKVDGRWRRAAGTRQRKS
jgi:hypothetical protein